MTAHTRLLFRCHVAGSYSAVAALNYFDEELFDWAAYLGEGNDEHIAQHGEKIDPVVASLLFPDIDKKKWRP